MAGILHKTCLCWVQAATLTVIPEHMWCLLLLTLLPIDRYTHGFLLHKPIALFLVCSREQTLMVGDQTLLSVFKFLLYNQIYSTVKLPPELQVLNILQHLHLLSPGHVNQSLVVVCCFM